MHSVSTSAQKRVLLIDDNADAVTMMQALLTALGYTVEAAHSGRAGIELAKTFRPQVVFLDLGMPIMSGYEVAAVLRNTPALSDVFLLALTGWNDQATRHAVIAAGFDRHLVKPPNFEQINAILNEHFDAAAVV
jgi:CheY-like chemotaxis protein